MRRRCQFPLTASANVRRYGVEFQRGKSCEMVSRSPRGETKRSAARHATGTSARRQSRRARTAILASAFLLPAITLTACAAANTTFDAGQFMNELAFGGNESSIIERPVPITQLNIAHIDHDPGQMFFLADGPGYVGKVSKLERVLRGILFHPDNEFRGAPIKFLLTTLTQQNFDQTTFKSILRNIVADVKIEETVNFGQTGYLLLYKNKRTFGNYVTNISDIDQETRVIQIAYSNMCHQLFFTNTKTNISTFIVFFHLKGRELDMGQDGLANCLASSFLRNLGLKYATSIRNYSRIAKIFDVRRCVIARLDDHTPPLNSKINEDCTSDDVLRKFVIKYYLIVNDRRIFAKKVRSTNILLSE